MELIRYNCCIDVTLDRIHFHDTWQTLFFMKCNVVIYDMQIGFTIEVGQIKLISNKIRINIPPV